MDATDTARVCYRHPDRATRVSCSECNRPICVECMHDAAVGQKCPECARHEGRGRVIQARAVVAGPTRRTAPVTIGLIAVNVIIYLLGELVPELGRRFLIDGAQVNVLVESGEWYRAFSAMFLHGSLMHILFNSYALWIFGPVLERRFGSLSLAALYLGSGLTGGAVFYLVGEPFVRAVGASGAIFGLFGALLAASYRQRHTPAGRAVFGQLGILLAINLALPLFVPNIAWEAHVGGLVAGALIAASWDRIPRRARNAVAIRVAFALGVAVAAVLLLLFA